jgi:hypothetical protein
VLENGGSVTGNLVGSGSDNTLIDDNLNNVWNITGTNSGTVNGLGGTFSNIQNIIGGAGNNTFNFVDGAHLTGTVTGSQLTGTNTLNFLNFKAPVTVQLSSNIFDGVVSGGGITETFTDINHLIGNSAFNDVIFLPSNLNFASNVVMTGNLQGFISDPQFFTGFTVNGNTPNGVSAIIEQPWQAQLPNPFLSTASFQYLDDYQQYLDGIKIDPWCFQEQSE